MYERLILRIKKDSVSELTCDTLSANGVVAQHGADKKC